MSFYSIQPGTESKNVSGCSTSELRPVAQASLTYGQNNDSSISSAPAEKNCLVRAWEWFLSLCSSLWEKLTSCFGQHHQVQQGQVTAQVDPQQTVAEQTGQAAPETETTHAACERETFKLREEVVNRVCDLIKLSGPTYSSFPQDPILLDSTEEYTFLAELCLYQAGYTPTGDVSQDRSHIYFRTTQCIKVKNGQVTNEERAKLFASIPINDPPLTCLLKSIRIFVTAEAYPANREMFYRTAYSVSIDSRIMYTRSFSSRNNLEDTKQFLSQYTDEATISNYLEANGIGGNQGAVLDPTAAETQADQEIPKRVSELLQDCLQKHSSFNPEGDYGIFVDISFYPQDYLLTEDLQQDAPHASFRRTHNIVLDNGKIPSSNLADLVPDTIQSANSKKVIHLFITAFGSVAASGHTWYSTSRSTCVAPNWTPKHKYHCSAFEGTRLYLSRFFDSSQIDWYCGKNQVRKD